MPRKKLQTTSNLIKYMRDEKGILFNIVREADAEHFISEHNYYFKLAAYRANYDKYPCGAKKGKYIDLEFAYLQELSRIDRFLRQIILDMCLNIEHEIKVELLKDIESNAAEDGYNIVSVFNQQSHSLQKLSTYMNTSYAKNLIKKYGTSFPIWAFCEVISFGDFCKLCNFYNHLYQGRLKFKPVLLYPIRDIRNAAAHSNCLIHNVRERNAFVNNEISNAVKVMLPNVSATQRKKMLGNKPIHDIVALCYFYSKYMKNENIRNEGITSLKNFLETRAVAKKEYFERNIALKNAYIFLRDFINSC